MKIFLTEAAAQSARSTPSADAQTSSDHHVLKACMSFDTNRPIGRSGSPSATDSFIVQSAVRGFVSRINRVTSIAILPLHSTPGPSLPPITNADAIPSDPKRFRDYFDFETNTYRRNHSELRMPTSIIHFPPNPDPPQSENSS